jgi:hypothetical protein
MGPIMMHQSDRLVHGGAGPPIGGGFSLETYGNSATVT